MGLVHFYSLLVQQMGSKSKDILRDKEAVCFAQTSLSNLFFSNVIHLDLERIDCRL